MAKCRAPRKGIKRPPRRPQADDHDGELTELVSVLAEYSSDNNATGWFKPPWRDGWNAVEMALHAAEQAPSSLYARSEASGSRNQLKRIVERREATSEAYWVVQDLLSSSITPDWMTRAALRCLQALVAKSDGGGEVYNAILIGPFSTVLPEDVHNLVLEYRCRDSIGTTAELQNDANDRQRRAFSIAWKRGLYHAAYSLPPAVKPAGKLAVVKGAK